MFLTSINITPLPWPINIENKIITAGSCFADCMGRRFEENKFEVLANPFGTVYNPISLSRQLRMSIHDTSVSENDMAELHGLYLNYQFHSSFADPDPYKLKQKIEQQISEVRSFIRKADYLILTWGTAWAYKRKDTDDIVANCQKQPQRLFEKLLLNPDEIIEDFSTFHGELIKINPDIKIILTVSPVRHIKETLPLNNVSKSVLRLAAHNVVEKIKNVHYFPSYEIMMDELRDYRFFKEDMIHPTPQAEEYIWTKFKDSAFDNETKDFLNEWEEIKSAMAHKAFNPSSEAHQNFIRKTIQKLDQLRNIVDVTKETEALTKQLL